MGEYQHELISGALRDPDGFWERLAEAGTPLVDPIAGEDASWVAFVGRLPPDAEYLVISGIDGVPADARMHRISGTDICYRSWRMASDRRVSYAFIPDLPLIDPADCTPEENAAFRAHLRQHPHNGPALSNRRRFISQYCSRLKSRRALQRILRFSPSGAHRQRSLAVRFLLGEQVLCDIGKISGSRRRTVACRPVRGGATIADRFLSGRRALRVGRPDAQVQPPAPDRARIQRLLDHLPGVRRRS
ncbi:MAG: DUF3327 domain-containing protein, partial [Pseudomonadales bacterium]|nr:DUF3327 domain-containing protein [Pseudomonadales bacterium]